MNYKNKKLYLYFGIGFGIIILLLVVIIVLNILVGGRINFQAAEEKMKVAAQNYFKYREDQLPQLNESKIVTIDELVSSKNIKSFDKLLKNYDDTCTGHVNVLNNNNRYIYIPYISCEAYTTMTLTSKIKSDNQTTTRDGLYEINGEYVFRGEEINNYVSFADKLWRIIKITDNSIRLISVDTADFQIWDDRFNTSVNSTNGINNFEISRIKSYLEEKYEELNENDKSYILSQNACVGKQTENSNILDGSIECSERLNGQYFTLLQLNEYYIASIDDSCHNIHDKQCSNYNYLSTFNRNYWTITGDANNSDQVFIISSNPRIFKTNYSADVKPVIEISNKVIYNSGNGTIEEPYTFKLKNN